MNAFAKLHPVLRATYYILIFLLTLTVNHPAFAATSLAGAFLYGVARKGATMGRSLCRAGLVLLFVSVFNMLFAHYGTNVLFEIRGTAFTLEALLYGLHQGLVLCAVLLWFAAVSETADSARVAYLLRFAPKTALLFSMVLGFLPRFKTKLKEMQQAQTALHGGKEDKSLRAAIGVLSALVTYSLESSIVTADSMRARGYCPGAVQPSHYKVDTRDGVLLGITVAFSVFVLYQKAVGAFGFIFEPTVRQTAFSPAAFVCFAALTLLPFCLEIWEVTRWKYYASKR